MKSSTTSDKTTQEDLMERPDLDTVACVHPECQQFCQAGQGNLVLRNVYGRDRMRLLRWRTCGEAFSERRSTALFHTKLPEAKAEDGINHLDRRLERSRHCPPGEGVEGDGDAPATRGGPSCRALARSARP